MTFPALSTSSCLSIVGIVLATAGALLLWRFVGEVVFVNKKEILAAGDEGVGVSLTIPHYTPELKARLRRELWLTRAGVGMTLTGGVLQLLAVFMA